MGVDADNAPGVVLKHPHRALPGPFTVPGAAGQVRGGAQEKMVSMNAAPGLSIKKTVVLPEGRRGASPADAAEVRQNTFQMFDLKIIGLLEADEIRRILF